LYISIATKTTISSFGPFILNLLLSLVADSNNQMLGSNLAHGLAAPNMNNGGNSSQGSRYEEEDSADVKNPVIKDFKKAYLKVRRNLSNT